MAKLQTDLKEFIALLNSHGVEYLVVGGHAVAFHGHPRFTGDSVEFDEAWSDRIAAKLDEQAVHFLGFDTLIRNKKASGRDKDLADVKTLIATARRKRS